MKKGSVAMSVSSLKTALLQGLAKPHTIINVDRHLYAYRTLALGQDADLFYGALGVWRTRPSSRFDLGLEAIYAPEQGNSIYSVDLGKSVLIGSYEHEDTPPAHTNVIKTMVARTHLDDINDRPESMIMVFQHLGEESTPLKDINESRAHFDIMCDELASYFASYPFTVMVGTFVSQKLSRTMYETQRRRLDDMMHRGYKRFVPAGV
jgi:hypothetical protein